MVIEKCRRYLSGGERLASKLDWAANDDFVEISNLAAGSLWLAAKTGFLNDGEKREREKHKRLRWEGKKGKLIY